MDGGTIFGSLDRIEAALARIEAQGGKAPAAPQAKVEDHQLAQRHEDLKAAVEVALSRIDSLLGDDAP